MTIKVPLALLAKEVDATSSANIAITAERDAVAVASLSGSMNERRPTAAARRPIVMVILTIGAFAPSASFVTAIKPPNKSSRTVITPNARLRPSGSSCARSIMAPEISTRAADISRIMRPAFAAFWPENLDKAVRMPNTSNIPLIASIALDISVGSIAAIPLIAGTIIRRAVDMANIPTPAVAAFLPAKWLDTISPANIPKIVTNASRLFRILFASISAIFSIDPISRFKATTVATTEIPDPSLSPLAAFETSARPTNVVKSNAMVSPMLVSLMSSRSSNAPIISFKPTAKATKVRAPCDRDGASFERTPTTVAKPTAMIPRTATLLRSVSGLRPSITFRARTRIMIPAAKPAKDAVPFIVPPNLFKALRAVVKPRSPALRTTNAPTADHILPISSKVNNAIDAARIPIAMATCFKASALICKE